MSEKRRSLGWDPLLEREEEVPELWSRAARGGRPSPTVVLLAISPYRVALREERRAGDWRGSGEDDDAACAYPWLPVSDKWARPL